MSIGHIEADWVLLFKKNLSVTRATKFCSFSADISSHPPRVTPSRLGGEPPRVISAMMMT